MITKDTGVPESHDILRGRKQIAAFLKISDAMVDQLIDTGIIPICRINNKGQGLIISTRSLLLQGIEAEIRRQTNIPKEKKKP